MAVRTVFDKQLGASSSNGIATSQSVTGGVPFVLNGSLTNYLSTTTTAAAKANTSVLTLTSVTGVTVGQSVTDSTTACIPTGTTVIGVDTGAKTVSLSQPIGGTAGVGSGDTIVFAGVATLDTATSANSAIGCRVVVAYSGSDTNFTVVGTNATGNTITDTIVGASGAGQSNLDFVTVTSITPVGSITAATAGTNGVGSSPWVTWNYLGDSPMNLGFAIELVSGSVNFTVQYTYDDPNALDGGAPYPVAFNHSVVTSQNATIDGSFNNPIVATRVLINSGTGQIRCRFEQAGVA